MTASRIDRVRTPFDTRAATQYGHRNCGRHGCLLRQSVRMTLSGSRHGWERSAQLRHRLSPAGVTVPGYRLGREQPRGTARVNPSEPNAPTTTRVGHRRAVVAVPGASGAEVWLTGRRTTGRTVVSSRGGDCQGQRRTQLDLPATPRSIPITFPPQAYQWEYATAEALQRFPMSRRRLGLRPRPSSPPLPAVSDGGRTYAFDRSGSLRPGSNRGDAATVRDSIERALSSG